MEIDLATRKIRKLLNSNFWPQSIQSGIRYTRVHDDCDGDMSQVLSVVIGDDGDAWVAADADTPFSSLRFRVPLIGGGMSPRVRNALLILAEAIRLDNEDRPQRCSVPDGEGKS